MRFDARVEVPDSELIPDILDKKPKEVDYSEFTIIVDGCPIVGGSKIDRLKDILLKKFSIVGEIIYHNITTNDNNETTGYVFFTYSSFQEAADAVKQLNNFALDKLHTLLVTLLSEYEKSVNINEKWTPIERKKFVDVGNLRSWLLNEYCRDQFAVVEKNGEQCSVYWHTSLEPILIEQRSGWSDGWIRWSPLGTYFATMHLQGVILWGGNKFARVAKFPHKDVQMIEFSPKERFIITVSPSASAGQNSEAPRNLADMIIWDIRKCLNRRNFTFSVDVWPTFKWSFNDTYVATLQGGVIFIYDTETFMTLNKKPLKANCEISDFSWSPSDNILAYCVPETSNIPARAILISIPNREELCTKNLFSVADISFMWHSQGDFLAIQVLRCTKKKIDTDKQVKFMGTYTNFEIVRMREKLYPVDQLEVKEVVSCFQWEPTGNRFAFITTDTSNRVNVAIYDVTKDGKVRELSMLSKSISRINELKWSTKGNIFVIANLKSADANIEFIDANDGVTLAKVEHAAVAELHWDPTGRYLASLVSSLHQKSDNAVWFWSCSGRLLHRMTIPALRTFIWRPRPPTLLSPEQCQTIKKNLSKYHSQFEYEDRMFASKASRDLLEKRQSQLLRHSTWKEELLSRYLSEKSSRDKLRGVDTEQPVIESETEEELEFLVSTSQEAVILEVGK